MMFDALLASQPAIGLRGADARFVKALIAGDPAKADGGEKRFLFDIVANKTNGIDVDKFDYIARDYRAIGEQTNTSFLRLIHSARVIRGEQPEPMLTLSTVRATGEARWFLTKATALRDETGATLAVNVIEDLTEERAAYDSLAEVAHTLQASLLPDALASKDSESLAAIVLHGVPGTPMPSWGSEISAAEAVWLVARLKHGIAP